MRIGSVGIVISFVCFFLSIYFVTISLFAVFDELLKSQLLAMATSFFVGGIVTTVLLIILKIAEKPYSGKRKTKTSHTLF